MLSIHIADLFKWNSGGKDNLPDVEDCSIYIFRGPSYECLYVGISQRNLYTRLQEHLGIGGWYPRITAIGRFILDNRPQSEEWIIEFYEPDEWIDILPWDRKQQAECAQQKGYLHTWLSKLEFYMVRALQSPFNTEHNGPLLPVPTKEEYEETQGAFRKYFPELFEKAGN